MYVSEDKVTYADLKYDDLYDYINALYKMSQYDCYNVFFSLLRSPLLYNLTTFLLLLIYYNVFIVKSTTNLL